MTWIGLCLLVLSLGLAVPACGGGANNAAPGNGGSGTAGGCGGHEHEGERVVVGKQKIGNYEVQLAQFGKASKGGEGVFEISTGASADVNKGLKDKIYVWIGDQDGKEISPKVKPDYAEAHNDFDGHCEVPKDAPAKAYVWVEVDGAKGSWELTIE
jgi:hypothetical protein